MKLVIPGDPIPQARMRLSHFGGFTRVYDPCTNKKNKLKSYLKSQFDDYLFEHPRISFVFHMPIPKCIPKKLRPLYESGILKHEKKPDTDNLIKLYLDCIDNIFFIGDQRVFIGSSPKLYHPEPKTLVYITETTQILTPTEIDPMIWKDLFGSKFDTQTLDGKVDLLDSSSLVFQEQCKSCDMKLPEMKDSTLF